MQIFFVVSFLSLFFFLYVVKVEKDQFEDQVNLIVDNILSDVKTNVTKIVRDSTQRKDLSKKLEELINNYSVPHNEFERIDENNRVLMSKTKKIVISFAVILLALIITLFLLHFCLNLTQGFMENLIVLVFIGLTEFTFLTVVASKYIAADPNQVKYTILNSIEAYALEKSLKEGQNMFNDSNNTPTNNNLDNNSNNSNSTIFRNPSYYPYPPSPPNLLCT